MMPATRHLAVTLLAAVATLVVTAVPALAHASLDVSSAPVDTDLELVVFAPLERGDVANTRIEALFPDGFAVDSCSGPPGWLCETSSASNGTVVTWSTVVETQDDFAFDVAVRTPSTAGTHRIPVVQTYADGHEAAWIGDGGDEPAPVLRVTDGAQDTTSTDDQPTSHTDPGSSDAGDDDAADDGGATDAPEPTGGTDEGTDDRDDGDAATAPQDPGEEAPATDDGATSEPLPATTASPAAEASVVQDMEDASTEPAVPDAAPAPTPLDAAPADDAGQGLDGAAVVAAPTAEDDGGGGPLAILAVLLLLATAAAAGWWWRTQ